MIAEVFGCTYSDACTFVKLVSCRVNAKCAGCFICRLHAESIDWNAYRCTIQITCHNDIAESQLLVACKIVDIEIQFHLSADGLQRCQFYIRRRCRITLRIKALEQLHCIVAILCHYIKHSSTCTALLGVECKFLWSKVYSFLRNDGESHIRSLIPCIANLFGRVKL